MTRTACPATAHPATTARPRTLRNRVRGFSLVEGAIVLGITSVLLAGAATPLRQALLGHRVEATSALLETDLKYARALALSSNSPVRFEVQTRADSSSCYVVYSGAPGSCQCLGSGQAQCQPDAQAWRVVEQPTTAGVRVLHSGRPLVFDPGKGTLTPTATLVVADADGRAIHQVVNIMGRTRSCSPSKLAGLKACV